MRKFNRGVLIIFLLSFILGCDSIQEMRGAREAAEKANKDAKVALENIKGYAEKAEAAAQRAENFSKKAEAASQKAVGGFEKKLKK